MSVQPMMLWLSSESKYAHLRNNSECNFVFKCEKGVCHYMRHIFFLKMIMDPFLYENLTTNQLRKPSASTMQMQICMNMPKRKYFCIFEINDMWMQ